MSRFKYYIINKPYRVISQFSESGDKQTLSDFLKIDKSVYPVGRLDYDSEGLLLLTNDNYLKTSLNNPRNEHSRTYLVQVDGDITAEALQKLKDGVEINIDGKIYLTKKCFAKKLSSVPKISERVPPVRFRAAIPTSFIEMKLTEGKNRQVRKMTAGVGFPTLRLIRTAIEDLTLNGLQEGEVREIDEESIYKLLKILKRNKV